MITSVVHVRKDRSAVDLVRADAIDSLGGVAVPTQDLYDGRPASFLEITIDGLAASVAVEARAVDVPVVVDVVDGKEFDVPFSAADTYAPIVVKDLGTGFLDVAARALDCAHGCCLSSYEGPFVASRATRVANAPIENVASCRHDTAHKAERPRKTGACRTEHKVLRLSTLVAAPSTASDLA